MDGCNYTPIKCSRTAVALSLGDKVMDAQGRCGTLEWCEVFNQYYIKPVNGGRIKTSVYIKVDKLFKYSVDTSRTECRRQPNKKRW